MRNKPSIGGCRSFSVSSREILTCNHLEQRERPPFTTTCFIFYLDKLIKVPKEAFLVDGKLVVPVENSVVLHFPAVAHAQRVVPRVVAALADQKEAVFTGLQ